MRIKMNGSRALLACVAALGVLAVAAPLASAASWSPQGAFKLRGIVSVKAANGSQVWCATGNENPAEQFIPGTTAGEYLFFGTSMSSFYARCEGLPPLVFMTYGAGEDLPGGGKRVRFDYHALQNVSTPFGSVVSFGPTVVATVTNGNATTPTRLTITDQPIGGELGSQTVRLYAQMNLTTSTGGLMTLN